MGLICYIPWNRNWNPWSSNKSLLFFGVWTRSFSSFTVFWGLGSWNDSACREVHRAEDPPQWHAVARRSQTRADGAAKMGGRWCSKDAPFSHWLSYVYIYIFIFFRGVGQPPTSKLTWMWKDHHWPDIFRGKPWVFPHGIAPWRIFPCP